MYRNSNLPVLKIENCTFENNYSSMGGSVLDLNSCLDLQITNSTMRNNTSLSHGGCILGKTL